MTPRYTYPLRITPDQPAPPQTGSTNIYMHDGRSPATIGTCSSSQFLTERGSHSPPGRFAPPCRGAAIPSSSSTRIGSSNVFHPSPAASERVVVYPAGYFDRASCRALRRRSNVSCWRLLLAADPPRYLNSESVSRIIRMSSGRHDLSTIDGLDNQSRSSRPSARSTSGV